jgi:hypothetical protein
MMDEWIIIKLNMVKLTMVKLTIVIEHDYVDHG